MRCVFYVLFNVFFRCFRAGCARKKRCKVTKNISYTRVQYIML